MKWFKAKRAKTIMTCTQHFQKFSNFGYKTRNQPKPATTSHNRNQPKIRTTQNYP